jgi:arylamine N-acetyltransferase
MAPVLMAPVPMAPVPMAPVPMAPVPMAPLRLAPTTQHTKRLKKTDETSLEIMAVAIKRGKKRWIIHL